MLTQLHINHLAIIDHCDLRFEKGFTVITGESGAGKSILIDAIELLSGKNSSNDMISNRANSAIIEAEFFIPFEYQPKPLQSFTDGLDHFFISRKIQRDKPSQARINGERVALKSLKDITPFCLQLTSQHDTQQLFDENFQKNLYDHYVGDVLLPLKKTFKSILGNVQTK